MRERALARVAIATGSDLLVQQGMRAWMAAGWQEKTAVAILAPAAERLRPEQDFQPLVALLASLMVWQAERSYGEHRTA